MDDITYNIDLAIEEMSELIQALSKHKRLLQEDKTLRVDKTQIRENIKEEIADVNIVLIKLKEMYFENNIEMIKFIGDKIRRTKQMEERKMILKVSRNFLTIDIYKDEQIVSAIDLEDNVINVANELTDLLASLGVDYKVVVID